MTSKEMVSPKVLENFFPVISYARTNAHNFIVSNGLKEKLSIGSKIGEGLILEDALATEIISEQISVVDSRIRRLKSGSLSRRRVLGAYTRHVIGLLEERAISLSWAFGYMIEETRFHRETYCRTPAQLESAGIVTQAVDELILIAGERGVPISDSGRFKDKDLSTWEARYREKLYTVT